MQETLISRLDPRSPEAEAFRELRTNIQFASLEQPLDGPSKSVASLLVTSSGQEEGKSTTAANLAISLAETGQRVILVDADLRRPSLHTLFGLPNQIGTSTVVLGGSLDEALQHTDVDHLLVLTSGPIPMNPAEVLGSLRMEAMMRELSTRAGFVIYDAPPVGVVTDGAVLATRVDGVVLVINSGKTRRDQARKAKEALNKVKAHTLGVVLNNVDLGGRGRYPYQYQV